MKLKKADMNDARFVFDIRNDRKVRSVSWNTDIIVWENHLEWFKKHFKEFMIILIDDLSVGYVRKDKDDISIALKDGFRNQHIASRILEDFVGVATIKFDNISSFNAFINAGFRPVGWIMKKLN